MKEIESMQEKIVKAICEQKQSTPYFGLLAEIGIWTVEQQLEYKQIMLLYNIITSKKERLIKEIIEEQIRNPWKGCWTDTIIKTCKKLYKE